MAVLDRHERLEDIGCVRNVTAPDGWSGATVSLTILEMAAALGRSQQSLQTWRGEGRFPDPTHRAVSAGGRPLRVYLLDEADRILLAYANHIRTESDYYRAEHTALRDALAAIPGICMRNATASTDSARRAVLRT
jgi:hypothetical protein